MLSSVTFYCQVTMIVMLWCSQLSEMSKISQLLYDCHLKVFSKCICHCHCLFLRLCNCLLLGQIMYSLLWALHVSKVKIALWRCSLNVLVFVFVFVFVIVFVFVFAIVFVVVFLLVRLCFLITIIKCIKGHTCLGSLCLF